ncbi:hypothetical protein HUJ05_000229 [Dendroctonus ponderosae]|nr:hypothetical protein HUJ05_000229 [Dendroctonus ponderosae]
MRLNNSFFRHKPQHKITWQNSRGQSSPIDYIIPNSAINPTQVLDTRSLTSANMGSEPFLSHVKNRSTLNAIFIVRQIVEIAIEYGKPAFMCFIDLTKAFDRVKLFDVINILRRKHIPEAIIGTINSHLNEPKTDRGNSKAIGN